MNGVSFLVLDKILKPLRIRKGLVYSVWDHLSGIAPLDMRVHILLPQLVAPISLKMG